MAARESAENPHHWTWLGPIVLEEAVRRLEAKGAPGPYRLPPDRLARVLDIPMSGNMGRSNWTRLQKMCQRLAQNPPKGFRVQLDQSPFALVVERKGTEPAPVGTAARPAPGPGPGGASA